MQRSRLRARGMVMILVLVLVALLAIVALAIITGANEAAQSATTVSIKYRVLNAAEGAENTALDDLTQNPTEKSGAHISGSLNGVNYDAWVLLNNLTTYVWSNYTDPATGKSILIPPFSAYIEGTASDNGGRQTYVEALAIPASPLTLPPGAVNAGLDIMDVSPMPINQDPVNPNDANIFANRNITVEGTPSTVQGVSSAVGQNDLPGGLSGQKAVPFPSSIQISEAARNAKSLAMAGSQVDATQILGTQTYSGNVYVNGDMNVTNGTVTFSYGTYVYVNGNVCVSGSGQIANLNTGQSEFVVSGSVQIAAPVQTGYTTSPGQNALMLVLGADGSAPTQCSHQNAIDFEIEGAPSSFGTLFAPNGSIGLTGAGSISGAVDAGSNVLLKGSSTTKGLQYDAQQATTVLNTGTLTYSSYMEY